MMQVPALSQLVGKSLFGTVVSLLERFFFTSSPSDNSPTENDMSLPINPETAIYFYIMVRTKRSAGSLGAIVVLVGQVYGNPQAAVSSYKSHQVGSSKSFREW